MLKDIILMIFADKLDKIGNSLSRRLAFCPFCTKLKIFKSIISFYSVFVVNIFKLFKFSTQFFLHYMTMFSYVPTLIAGQHTYNFISVLVQMPNATFLVSARFIRHIALKITKSISKFQFRPVFSPVSFLFTESATENTTCPNQIRKTVFYIALLRAYRGCAVNAIKYFPAIFTKTTKHVRGTLKIAHTSIYSHFLSPLKEMGRAVVHEAEASQHAPKRENSGYFVNTYSIANLRAI